MSLRTEEEARQCACHRTLSPDIWSNPRENEGECRTLSTPCIASLCQAWRWSASAWIERRIYRESVEHRAYLDARFDRERKSHNGTFEFDGHRWQYEYSGFDDSGEFDLLTRPNPEAPRLGFCGLAGSPS
jgi:hypothetical protein